MHLTHFLGGPLERGSIERWRRRFAVTSDPKSRVTLKIEVRLWTHEELCLEH